MIEPLSTWLCDFFSDKTGKFPEYPSDDEDGSALLFKEKTPEEVNKPLNFDVMHVTLFL